jgi:SAM-dependent methyltransferase
MSEDTHNIVHHWQHLQNMLRGYRQAQVLITAGQLDIFRQLATGPLTAQELSQRIDADPGALRRLLDAAVALELLQKEDGAYANSPMSEACLAREGRFYLGNLVRREAPFYRRWSRLLQGVRSGRQVPANEGDEESLAGVRDFALGLLDLARVSAPAIAEALPVPQDRPVRVLDVGGGHGAYSIALARRHPHVQATVFELPHAAEVAREVIASEEMGDRVSVQTGDFQQEGLGSGYDLILLFGVLGGESADGRRVLLRKTYDALAPGGALAIRGYSAGDPARSLDYALFSLHLLLFTEAGDSPTYNEVQQVLQETGYQRPEFPAIPEWVGAQLLIARKPAS